MFDHMRILWPMTKKTKMRYLELGFQELGATIMPSGEMTDKAIESEVYPFVIENGKETHNVYLDIASATDLIHPEFMDGKGFYFKVHMKKEDLGRYQRFYPMAQSAGSNRFPKYLKRIEREGNFNRTPPFDVHGVFLNSDLGLRMRTVRLMKQQPWKTYGWVSYSKTRGAVPVDILGHKMNYFDHLESQWKSKICLALPGGMRKSYLTFRHVEIWGMGRCCLTINPTNRIILGDPKDCWIGFKDDLSDFVEIVNYYLEHDDERERIAKNGKAYYAKYLTPKAHAQYILNTIMEEKDT